ncbi:MAG: dienelactone hydrolase family protein [Actinobacteria bacterium]|nr:dienelactone hydrolase family protein [Actinomycetota bacterium]
MRIVLPSGTPAEIDQSAVNPSMGLVIIPDIFGLRPLFEEMVARFAQEWNMAVIAFEPFPGRTFSDDVAERFAAMSQLDDDACMGGMYCHKAAQHERFARIASFYGMIHVPSDWAGPKQAEPISCLKAGNADRVLAIIGSQDPYTPPTQVNELRDAGVTVVEYEEAAHGFAHDPSRPAHRAEDAADAFSRTHRWLLS